jgi:hemolysin III
MEQPLSKDGSVHVTDEVFNTWSAGFGALLGAIGTVFLVLKGVRAGQEGAVLGFSIYGVGLVAMFLSSALHHGVNGSPRTNHLLRELDYYAIFVMIAGTFTPFCLVLMRDTLGWTVLGLIWVLAVSGIVLKLLWPKVPSWLLTSLFIGMGWLGVLIAQPVYQAIQWEGMSVLVLGGLAYSVGALVYGFERPNPFPGKFGFHEIWHCFVLGSAACHFLVIYFYL